MTTGYELIKKYKEFTAKEREEYNKKRYGTKRDSEGKPLPLEIKIPKRIITNGEELRNAEKIRAAIIKNRRLRQSARMKKVWKMRKDGIVQGYNVRGK